MAELVKVDSAGQGAPVAMSARPTRAIGTFTHWTPAGHIAYSGQDGVRLCDLDGTRDRLLVPGGSAGDFNQAGNLFYAIRRDGNEWRVLTVDVSDGRVLRSTVVNDSPAASFSSARLTPDGKRLAITRNENRYDVWMLDGLPRPETGWMRLFRHWTK
jgi:hypothetical protein